jgi:hypothetical protein
MISEISKPLLLLRLIGLMKVRVRISEVSLQRDLMYVSERLDKLPRSKKAGYDGDQKCLSGTRQAILSLIYDWIGSKEPGHNVFWLRGAPGSGKSTIASTVAAQLDSRDSRLRQLGLGSLGATFFCKRDDDSLNQPGLVFPTLAFRLASAFPLLKEGILSALKADPDIGQSPIANQFQKLIFDPLSLLQDRLVAPVVIIIDAVDECGNESTRKPFLQSLKKVGVLPIWFKVLVTSRPEQDIKICLAGCPSGHEVDTSSQESISDIRAYTEDRIISLRAERELDSQWPGDLETHQLITRAAGLFIWTTLSFDFMCQHPSPSEALELVLEPTGQSYLDALYRTVLTQGLEKEDRLPLVRSILGFVVVSRRPLSLPSLCALLNISKEKATWARNQLASVLPPDSSSAIRVIHPSFLDFLTNRQRSDKFFIDVEEHNLSLARGCLRVMNGKLRTNICRVTDQTVLNDEIPDLASRLDSYILEDLAYSCESWSDHLQRPWNRDPEILPLLNEFCETHVLHWLEVMSLRAETRNAIMAVRNIQKWLPVSIELVDISVDMNMHSCPRYVA